MTEEDNLRMLWEAIAPSPTPLQKRANRVIVWLCRAGAVLFIPLAVWFVFSITKASSPQQVPLIAWNEIVAAPGETAEALLPDGTKVLLNSGSHLVYPESFEAIGRQVFFSGEADFDVSSDKEHPFVISTGDTHVKVLGTHFNLDSYREDNILKIQLYEGSVEFSYDDINGQSVTNSLAPGEELSYNKSTGATTVTTISEEASWMSGIYYFRNMPLEKIAHSLERIYGVRIEILSDSVKQLPFFMVISKNDNIDDIVEILSSDARFTIQKKGDFIEIK